MRYIPPKKRTRCDVANLGEKAYKGIDARFPHLTLLDLRESKINK